MDIPKSGIYVVLGEMSTLLTTLKRNNRWSSNNHQDDGNDLLIRSFTDLKDVLNHMSDLRQLDPNHFLGPFLEVIKSEETTSPVTCLALSAVHKFLSYSLIDHNSDFLAATVNNIANVVTHAKFVGTDQTNDAVVLLKILQVLRTLILSPSGTLLTNKSVCDIMLSCFRICFEMRLNELLRRFAESCLKDMVQLLFTRLPTFSEDIDKNFSLKKIKMRTSSLDSKEKSRDKKSYKHFKVEKDTHAREGKLDKVNECEPRDEVRPPAVLDMQGSIHNSSSKQSLPEKIDHPIQDLPEENVKDVTVEKDVPEPTYENECQGVVITMDDSYHEETKASVPQNPIDEHSDSCTDHKPPEEPEKDGDTTRVSEEPKVDSEKNDLSEQDRINQQGVRFTSSAEPQEGGLEPYGLVCVQELLRLFASLCNPQDKQNTEPIIQTGLALVAVALEVGADSIARFPSLLDLVRDDLCRSLFALLSTERLSLFAADAQVCFLLFESLRTHLKFQFQLFLSKLTDIIISDSSKSYEMREISLETIVQLWRIPGLVTELYLNYDCDLYCPNMYEELTNLLSKNAFPVSGVYNIHLLSLDALLTVTDSIENHCHKRILNERQQSVNEKSDLEKAELGEMSAFDPRAVRQKISAKIPSHEEIMAIKRKKELLTSGTEHFNSKPKKGVQFLQDNHLLSSPLDPEEVVGFLRENPHLDKKMIGEYISNRANLNVLNAFVKSFNFSALRIDEALRLYLETFRLPGESPLIALVMEHFADHWHKCNNEPFANADAAFTLAYAVIMLNVDQHNHNVRKQNIPMTCEDFKKNLKNVNGGKNFEESLLDTIYESIKADEIVMPAEQTGSVRENYLWRVMLRRGGTRDGVYLHAPAGLFDHNLFSLIWSPTVAALSFLFDKTTDPAIYQKALSGFRKCAMISAHYGMSNDFDNLIISLCKFTTLLNSLESPEAVSIAFGSNPKARLATKAVFNLAHRHGDIIKDSWRNILECILQLYRCKLLPKILVEAEDFVEISGKISLIRDEMMSQLNQKSESGLLRSIYSYILADPDSNKTPTPEDLEAMKLAQNCIRECLLEHLVTESKFLRFDSLQHFIQALIRASYGPEGHVSLGSSYNEGTAVFFLEFLLKVVVQNRDRIGSLWPKIKEHIYTLMMGAAACNHQFLVERCVVGLLRLAIRLMRREELCPTVLQSLRMLLLLKTSLQRVSRQVAYGMFELLKTSASNIHSATDWAIIFTLLECVGAGAPPPRVISKPPVNESGAKSEGECGEPVPVVERGYTSDSELNKVTSSGASSPDLPQPTGWILVGKEGEIQPVTGLGGRVPPPEWDRELGPHDPFALVRCCDSLYFLVRDVAHITPYNFENCVHCISTFVQATVNSNNERKSSKKSREGRNGKKKSRSKKEEGLVSAYDADESDSEDLPNGYQQVCIQLVDLMFTLHTRTAQIYKWWAEEEGGVAEHASLWQQGWCPLLEGISSLCAHPDRQVRMSAITYLQRALLVSDLATLTGPEWESCFTRVLFPLLRKMLEPSLDPASIEETRIRAATVLSKVFLHHLSPLQTLPSFLELWMTILDYMDSYMHADHSDLLFEAVPESLKNMLLVMDSADMFYTEDRTRNELWGLTWDRINSFLPNLQAELFRARATKLEDEFGGQEAKTAAEAKAVTEEERTPESDLPPPEPQEVPPELAQPVPEQPTKPSEEVPTIVTASLVSNPQNWQPPAPLFPYSGQILSTPIGGPGSCAVMAPGGAALVSPESSVQGSEAVPSLPFYSGFNNSPSRIPPSAQFFYQDLPQIPSTSLTSQQPEMPSGSILLPTGLTGPTEIPQMPVATPSDAGS